jgi:hypothetical protein
MKMMQTALFMGFYRITTRLSLLFTIMVIWFGCTSPRKLYDRGAYDAATRAAVVKLQKRHRDKHLVTLERAYGKANQVDLDRIAFLKKQGTPDVWDEVFGIYLQMKNRQDFVKTVTPRAYTGGSKRTVSFPIVNYDDEILHAKQLSADYYYAHGLKLLNDGGKRQAREAYDDFLRVKDLYKDYKDVDKQIALAQQRGISNVFFKMENKSGAVLPQGFEAELKKMTLQELNGQWVKFDVNEQTGKEYDFTILLTLNGIHVSPDALREVVTTETKEVPDGFQYVLDSKGNVKKDSLGNDIKVPKMKTIKCLVTETIKHKEVTVTGVLDFYDLLNHQLVRSFPVKADAFFDNAFVIAIGDYNALKPETKKKMEARPVPFPNDLSMIMQSATALKNTSKDIIWNNYKVLY